MAIIDLDTVFDAILTSRQTVFEGGVSGVPIPQNRTEIRVNTAQNNIRKPQTALKLPENF